MLDLRFNKTSETLLGDAQKTWLEQRLRSSTTLWTVIVSTVTFNSTTHKTRLETWASYDEEHDRSIERQWLVDLINGIEHVRDHVVFVSGDIHSGGALDDGTWSDFPEISVPSTNTPIITCTLCDTEGECANERACGLCSHLFNHHGVGYGIITATRDTLTMTVHGRYGQEKESLVILAADSET